MRVVRFATCAVAASFFAACGGGGGAGGGGGQDPGAGLSIAPAAVSFDYMEGGPFAGFKDVAVTITAQDAAYVVVGYPPGTTSEPPWLHLELSGSGASWTLRLAIWQNPPAGTYEATVRVVIARADQSLIGYEDVQVTYTVRRGVVASPSTLSLTAYKGSSTSSPGGLDIRGTVALPFTASASEDWVMADAWSGTVPARVYVTANPGAAAFELGTYSARMTFVGGAEPSYVDVDVTVVPPVFYGYTLLDVAGYSFGAAVSNTAWVSISTGQNAYPFQVTGAPAWLQVSPAAATISEEPVTLTFTADPAALAAGTHLATVDVTADVLGTVVTQQVTVRLTLQ